MLRHAVRRRAVVCVADLRPRSATGRPLSGPSGACMQRPYEAGAGACCYYHRKVADGLIR